MNIDNEIKRCEKDIKHWKLEIKSTTELLNTYKRWKEKGL